MKTVIEENFDLPLSLLKAQVSVINHV